MSASLYTDIASTAVSMQPPPFSTLYLSEYIQYWQTSYEKALALKEADEEELERQEEHIEAHLCKHFNRLRSIIDDDYFEWNQAMMVFLVLCQWRNAEVKGMPMEAFCRKNNLLRPVAKRMSEAMLLLKHVDDRWSKWDLTEVKTVARYVREVHRSLAKFVVRAGNLRTMDRWNFLQSITEVHFRMHPKGIFYACAHVALQLKSIEVGKFLLPRMEPMPAAIEADDREHFLRWAEKQETYYSIRTFRSRIQAFLWLFLHDEAGRCFHTYSRAGEVPTIYAHVTSKYPSGWIGNLAHETSYSEPIQLIRHDSDMVRDANILALFEAAVKTLYSVEFIKYCFCLEHSIVDMGRKLTTAEHPIILRAWGKWGVMQRGKFFYSRNLVDSIVLWLQIIKTDYDGKLLKSFNITNLINQCLRVNKKTTLDEAPEASHTHSRLFEVCL